MVGDRIKPTVEALNKVYPSKNFSGIIKIGIEKSNCSSVIEQNSIDCEITPITDDYLPDNFLMNLPPEFYGSIVYRYEKGKIDGYAYTRNYRNDSGFNAFYKG